MNEVRKMREDLIQLLQAVDERKIDSKVFAKAVERFKRQVVPSERRSAYTESYQDHPNHTQDYDKYPDYEKEWSEDWSDSAPNGHEHDKTHDKDSEYSKSWSDSY